MKYKLFPAPFLTILSNVASYSCQIKIFTWCLEGSTSPIKMVESLFGFPCPPPSPYDNFTTSPTYMYALPSPINMTNMIRQHAMFLSTARPSR